MSVVRLFLGQLGKGVPGVFQELHLSQIRAQRVSRRRDSRNGGVTSLLGRVPRFLGGVSKRFALLSD